MKNESKIIFLVTSIGFLLSNLLWTHIKELTGVGIYYQAQAFAFLGYTFIIYNESKGVFKSICKAIVLTCLGTVVDELFFDPTKFELNEFLAFGIIVVFLIEDLINYKRNGHAT